LKYISFGNTGIKVSEICLGTMMFGERIDEKLSIEIMHRAFDEGVNFFDTAGSYGGEYGHTEEIVGKGIKGFREKIFLASKIRGVDAGSILEGIDESLTRLKTDYLDLYQIHWPRKGMMVGEMMEALDKVVKSGKARFIGCCNFPAWVLGSSNAYASLNGLAAMVSHQLPYNLLERGVEVEVLPMARTENIAVMVYRPIAMGILSGKYMPDEPMPEDSRAKTDERIAEWLDLFGEGLLKLRNFAVRRGVSVLDVSVAWVRSSPAVTCPIIGVSSVSQFESNLKVLGFSLSPEERDEVSSFFDAEVKEVSGGNYGPLRRDLDLVASTNAAPGGS
jgi:aryl-alcohol dehydrogenase-like predicted oxidoreductase